MATADARASASAVEGGLRAADGTPLKTALARATARSRRRALFLVLPLLAFVLVAFALPIALMLYRSVSNPGFSENMPNLVAWFAANPQATGTPGDDAFEALARDIVAGQADKTVAIAGTRINYEYSGATSLFKSTGRKSESIEGPAWKDALVAIDAEWGDPALWGAMRRAAATHTASFYLAALDLTYDEAGNIVGVEQERKVYVTLFTRTLVLSAAIAAICLALAYPIAYLMAGLQLRYANLLMILVLLPFWTSLLVRTTSWIVLLQSEGVINDLLVATGVIGEDGRVQMIYNQTGTVIAMTHILLPFMVLPLYSVMKTISPSYLRAARSLGATPFTAFIRVYLPLTAPGIAAGTLLVFILAVGYYITPALVGGSSGQLISNLIAFHMQRSLNWSLAAALAALLLACIVVLYWLYDRLVGIDRMKLG